VGGGGGGGGGEVVGGGGGVTCVPCGEGGMRGCWRGRGM